MNDKCLMCEREWEQGDVGIVIGVINEDGGYGYLGSLGFAHRDCLVVEVLGDRPDPRAMGAPGNTERAMFMLRHAERETDAD